MSLEMKGEINCCVSVWSFWYFYKLVLLHFVLWVLFGWVVCYWIFCFVFRTKISLFSLEKSLGGGGECVWTCGEISGEGIGGGHGVAGGKLVFYGH